MATVPHPPIPPPAAGARTPQPAAREGQWLFGRYRLEPASRRLMHADGWTRNLDARGCAVLLCLLRRAEHVVPRATLIAEAWPGVDSVFDSAVSKVMRRLRTALDDHSGHVLQTIYGEGYRLALPAVLLPPAPEPPPADPPGVDAWPAPAAPPRPSSPLNPWLSRLPWAIAAVATLVALFLAWLLMHPEAHAA